MVFSDVQAEKEAFLMASRPEGSVTFSRAWQSMNDQKPMFFTELPMTIVFSVSLPLNALLAMSVTAASAGSEFMSISVSVPFHFSSVVPSRV